ncbi:MAG: peptide ABC transporter substrate-binding protein [Firmicutes bacterium]|nr:peptide ABC transporter substrate-binding protein [Bacillota bacterium]
MQRYAITILWVLLLVAVVFSPSSQLRAAVRESLAVNFSEIPLSIDPETAVTNTEKILLANLHEGLVTWDNGILVPAAARSLEVSGDGLVYTFHLRESFWSNGDPVTAYDFHSTWRRLLAPGSKFQYGFLFDIIVNARAYRSGQLDSFAKVGIRALDEKTLQVELAEPAGHFLALLTLPQFFPVHSLYNTAGSMEEKGAYLPGFCSNGPYCIKEWEPRDYVVLEPNRHYARGRVYLERVKITFLAPAAAISLYGAGLIDLMDEPPLSDLSKYGPDLVQAPTGSTGYLYLNLRRPPLNNPLVREALALAIDRGYIAEKIMGLNGIPATGLISPGIPDGITGQDFRSAGGDLVPSMDIEKARALLSRAGYPGEDGFPPLELVTVEGKASEAIARAIAEMWEINLGLTVRVKVLTWPEYEELCATGRFYTARAGWISDYPDPAAFLNILASGAYENFSAYRNGEYDRWLQRVQESTEIRERMEICHALERMVLRDWPVIPVYFATKPYFLSKELQELAFSPQGYPLFNTARWK